MKKILLLPALFFAMYLLSENATGQASRDWTIVASYTIPGKASGLAWDGTYLYSGIYGTNGDQIYQIDPSDGSYTLLCSGPQEDAYGLTFDGTNLWTTDHPSNPAQAMEFNFSGTLLSSFNLPAQYMSGIEYDDGDFWVCAYYNPDGMVYKLDGAGNILKQFAAPDAQPWDICKENEYLWIADYWGLMLYKIDTNGALIESHASNQYAPAGVTFDGQYLWYCDGALGAPSTLYKVDLGGSGTPEVTIPDNVHDFGIVTVGETATWDMLIQNTGAGNLVIDEVDIPAGVPVSTTFTTPYTLTPGSSTYIPFIYAPLEIGTLYTVVNILTNDPVTPSSPVTLTGQAVGVGPVLQYEDVSHQFGPVRITASTRWYLRLWNIGSDDLVISDIEIVEEAFYLDADTELPLTLAPLDTASIGFWFSPDTAINYNDQVHIFTNDPDQDPFNLYLLGSGLDTEWPIGDALWYYFIDVSYDNSPKSIISINDITNDKVNDVIVGSEDNFIRCFNGNSHGLADVMWEQEIYAGSVYHQNSMVAIDDINSDNSQEVIVGTAWGDRSVIAYSGKTGQQLWKHDTHEYGSGGWVYQVDARFDYNDDGYTDILAATGNDADGTGPRRIYCLDARTGQSIWECFTGGPNFSVIGIEDVTGDGVPDALAGASNSQETQGKVYCINGATGAIFWNISTSGSSVWALEQLNDINDDGVKDIIYGDFGGYIELISGATGANLGYSGVGSNLILRFVKVDDINEDGHEDILIAHSGNTGKVISGYDGTDIWAVPLEDKPWNVAKSNDLNGDGISDVLIGTLYSNNYCHFMSGADGSDLHSLNFSTPVDAINAIPDIVGDHTFEMVAGGRDGRVYCYSGGIEIPVDIAEPPHLPLSFHSSAAPNPFSNQTVIDFYLPAEENVSVEIFSSGGKLIQQLFSGKLPAGKHQVIWTGTGDDGQSCANGIYHYRVLTGQSQSTGRLIFVR
jgi:hypothetical protein